MKTPDEIWEEQKMQTREEVNAYCLKLPDVYEDYPFHDSNWALMRLKKNQKSFVHIYERNGLIWLNVKCRPEWRDFWRDTFPSVVPGYHMNKEHWNSIILDGSVPDSDIKRMIEESYDLVRGRDRTKKGTKKYSKNSGKTGRK